MLQGRGLFRKKEIKIKKRNKSRAFYFTIVIIFLITIVGFFLYFYFLSNNPSFISPLAKAKFQESIRLEEALQKANIKFIKTTPQNDLSFLVELTDKEEVIFSSKKDLQSQIASLQLITKRLTIEGKRFKRLDFRYDKPMIVF